MAWTLINLHDCSTDWFKGYLRGSWKSAGFVYIFIFSGHPKNIENDP